MKKNQKLKTVIGILSSAGALLAAASSQAAVYQVNVNTSSLVGNANGPYYVDFQLNYGSGTGNGVVISDFNSAPAGSPIIYSGTTAGGDMSTALTITDNLTSPFNEIAQQFTPGTTLSFLVNLSQNGTASTPDEFVFGIDDGSTFPISTTSPDGGSLALFQINHAFSNPVDSEVTYSASDAQYSSLTVSVVAVPEPSTAVAGCFALGLGAVVLFRSVKPMRKAA
jgi:hypothetical protein